MKDSANAVFYPQTHEKAVVDSNGVNLQTKLASITTPTYVTAWDGDSTPVVANIPAGVTVTYNTTSYTGTLAASASTANKTYLVSTGTTDNYNRYVTQLNGSTYSWQNIGSTEIDLSDYATKEELNQLDQQLYIESIEDLTQYAHVGGYINLNGKAAGTVIDITDFTANAQYNGIVITVQAGDHIRVKGSSGSGPRLWGFLDNDKKLLSVAQSGLIATTFVELEAAQNGYFISNYNNASTTAPYAGERYTVAAVKDEVIKLIANDPKQDKELQLLLTGKTSDDVAFTAASTVVEYPFQKGEWYRIYNTSPAGTGVTISLVNSSASSATKYNVTNAAGGYYYDIIAEETCQYLRTAQNATEPTFTIEHWSHEKVLDTVTLPGDLAEIDAKKSYLSFNFLLKAYLASDGTVVYNTKYCLTPYIQYAGGDIVVRGAATNNACLIVYYDSSQSVLGYLKTAQYNDVLTHIKAADVPAGTALFRCTGFTENGLSSRRNYLSVVDNRGRDFLDSGTFTFGAHADGNLSPAEITAYDYNSRTSLAYWYGMYDGLVSQYPDYVSKVDLDTAYAGTTDPMTKPSALADMPLYLYKFVPYYTPKQSGAGVDDTNTNRLKVFIVTGTHPEYTAIYDCFKLMEAICASWKNDPNLWDLRWNAEFYVMPCSGPWGIVNASRVNYNGVDLNRNAPTAAWKLEGAGTNTYSGPTPASEYETKVWMYALEKINPVVFIDHHSSWSSTSGNVGYATSICKFAREVCAALFADMTFRLKEKYDGTMTDIDEAPLVAGYARDWESLNTRSVYGNEHGAISATFETADSFNYADGSISQQPIGDLNACNVALYVFGNFVVRLLKEVAGKIIPTKYSNLVTTF